jgi:putative ABC transport system permease protein
MIRNYFTIALRNFHKHKAFTLINVLGLSIGMATCLLILQYVSFELSYDRFHQNIEQLYRITTRYPSGEEIIEDATTQSLAGPMLKETFPEVRDYARFYIIKNSNLQYQNRRFKEDKIFVASPSFLTMFTWEFLQGDPQTALNNPLSIVITESVAKRYFVDEDPLGKVLTYKDQEDEEQMTVTGVVKDNPANSHLHFDALVSYGTALETWGIEPNWNHKMDYTYLLLTPDTQPGDLEAKLPEFERKHLSQHDESSYELQPLAEIHLHSHKTYEIGANGSYDNVYALLIVAFIVVLIAWVNYVNLTTVQSLSRANETSIRKILGASRNQLTRLFLLELLLLNSISLLLALVIVMVSYPFLQRWMDKPFSLEVFSQAYLWILAGAIFFGGTLLSSFYPAFVLSAYHPIKILKKSFKASEKGNTLRKALVIIQFSMTMMLLAATFTVHRQISFMKKQELSADMDQTLVLHAPWFTGSDSIYLQNYNFFENEIGRLYSVRSIAVAQAMPGNNLNEMAKIDNFYQFGKKPNVPINYYFYGVDENYISTLGLTLKAGTNFQHNEMGYQHLILNETAMLRLGYDSPEEVIQTQVMLYGRAYIVIGVVADYHFLSLKEAHIPIVLYPVDPNFINFYAIKLDMTGNGNVNYQDVIADIKQVWLEAFPNSVFDYYFLDERFDAQYKSEVLFGQIFGLFSGFAIFISCLGLLGLSAFTGRQRTKEIGIRRVLGASVSNILLLLSKDYMKLMLIAFLIAIPIANYFISEWLQNFAYRIEISWWLFGIPGVMVLLIAALSVSSQTLKAAIKNPVDSLRYE